MPGWLKVLLIIVVILVLLVVGVIGAGVFWWSRNKDAVIGRLKEVGTQGKDFGGHSDNQGCVDESLNRYKKDPGISSAISTSIFMRTCLDASHATVGFCDNVPKPTEFMRAGEWRRQMCNRYDLSKDSYCQQLFQPVQEYCIKRQSTGQ